MATRNVINISLPPDMVREIKKEVKEGQFASVSEYVRHLIRTYRINKLAAELHEDRKQFDAGNYKLLKSLKDLR